MKRTKITLFAIIIFNVTIILYPCTCRWHGPFLKMIKGADLVIYGQIIKQIYVRLRPGQGLNEDYDAERGVVYAEVSIIKVYKGKVKKKTIRVYGDDGNDCRVYMGDYTAGTKYLFALYKNGKYLENDHETKNDYHLSLCGEFSLRVQDFYAIGHISNKKNEPVQKMKLIKVEKQIK